MKNKDKYPIKDREHLFWPKVKKQDSGCWEWQAHVSTNGYGQFFYVSVHRASWFFTNGEIPGDMCVLHHCDNRICVNPDHLFLGDRADNHRDMREKGRMPVGEKRAQAKAYDAKVLAMRWLCKQGVSIRKVAEVSGLSVSNTHRICTHQTWSHI